ncbi:MAG: RHS repeat-associated core domain-containing protein [Nocardioides sp.]|uniref:RHS repeat-associated core domain-containing protein n=1 Tax=Nocardioides sp. TaxID=35761 RepID=UPI0032655398
MGLLAGALIFSGQSLAQAAEAADPGPVLGGQLFSTGTAVTVEVLPASAGLTSTLFLLDPAEVRIATNRDVGTTVTVGPYGSGTELVFGIRAGGQEFRLGPGARNPDGIPHAVVDFGADGCAVVGFEDLFGGGDRDYDDNKFKFCGGIAAEVPVEPEVPPTPDPVAPPVADAGPDQTVDEGSTVTLNGSASKASTKPALQASEQQGTLPGGTSIGATLQGLDGDAADLRVKGSVSIGQGPAAQNTSIAYVIDVSGSAGFAGGPCGDVNGDRRSNTILDCELAAALKLQEEVQAAGTVDKVAVITFSSGATAVDLDPTSATATLVSPSADKDANGVNDVVQAIKRVGGSGGTNFLPPVKASCQLLATTGSPNLVTAFMSDGQGSGSLKTLLPCSPAVTFHAFAVGSGSSCNSGSAVGSRLIDMATLSGGTCTDVPTVSDLPDILPQVVGSKLTKVTYTVDGGTPVDLSAQLELPKDGPVDVDIAFDLPAGLSGGSHRICLTVTGVDSGGTSSETTCSDLVTVTGEVSYWWRPGSHQGPPVFLSSRTAAHPTFLAPDDGRYVFELTVTDGTGGTATDEVVVEVRNLLPSLELTHGDSFAGGVTQVNATLTDAGWLDSHSAVVDWGDGTTTPVEVTTAGAGWGTFFGSHVYRRAGSFDVVVTLTDDDGGVAIQRLDHLEVTEPAAVWANSTASRSLDWAGGSGEIQGRVHTNGELRFVGASKTIRGASTYAGSISADTTRNSFTPLPVQSGVLDFPINPQVADFRPGGPVAAEVGSAYHDMSALCSSGSWHDVQSTLASGVYYANCDIQLNGSQIGGRVTLVSEGHIKIAGSRPAFEPYRDGLLMLAGATGTKAIDISTSSSKFLGVLFAGSGEISVSGGSNRFYCGILGNTVAITGTDVTVRGADCGRPGQTVSGPVVVPDLAADLTVDRERALPNDLLGYDVTVTNRGTTLVVPSLIGLENVDTATARVVGHDFTVERQVATTGAWVPVASLGDPSMTVHVRPNPFEGVQYAADGAIVGTTVAPGGWATWGVQAELTLTPAQITELLDQSRTTGVRTRVDFTLDPSTVQARRLYTYGTDFAAELRVLGADATDVAVTSILPDGDAEVIQITDPDSRIGPGESVTRHREWTVGVPAPRAATETDAGYLSRLLSLDGTQLNGAAYAQATGGVGRLVAPLQRVTTTRELPVVAISAVGSTAIPAGSSADYDLKLANLGSADASAVDVAATADTASLTVTGAPAGLAAGELATARTSYAAPAASSGSVVLRGTAAWNDARGNTYGLSGSDLAIERQLPATVSASLVDALVGDVAGDGAVSPGDTVRYTLTVANRGGLALTGVTGRVPVPANATLIPGSGTTPDGGTVSLASGEATFTLPNIAGSTTRRVVFDVLVAQPFPAGTARIEAQGSVSATGLGTVQTDDPALPGTMDPTRTTVTRPTPALIASLSGRLVIDADGSGGVSAGDTLAYDLSISSVGTQQVTGIDVDIPAPAGTTVVADSVRTSQGTVTGGPGVGIDLGTLAPFQQADVSFRLRLGSPLPAGTTSIRAQGTLTSDQLDPITTDDPQTVTVGDATDIPIGSDGGNPELPAATVGDLSPADGARIATLTDVAATLTAPASAAIATWRIELTSATGGQPQVLASGTGSGPTANVSAQIDPTLLENGLYVVSIISVTSDGAKTASTSSVIVDGGFKPGRLTTSFLDHQVGLGGLPLQVIRSYDSFDSASGDFGVGWKADVADFRIGRAKPLGQGGWSGRSTSCGLVFCNLEYVSSTPHMVSVVWPDGHQEVFDLKGVDGSTFFSGLARAKFFPRSGTDTTSTLEVVGDDAVFFSGGDLRSGMFGSAGVFDPTVFKLTDRNGVEYVIDRTTGLQTVKDRAGNTLTFTRDGVKSSLGKDIAYTRDTEDRITRIVSPAGTTSYGYANGDLVTSIDLAGVVTRYEYDGAHNLTNVIGSGGVSLGRSVYDAAGRLIAWIDGEGNRTEISTDLAANQERVTDPTGKLTTVTTFSDDGDKLREDQIADGQTHSTKWTYDAQHRMLTQTDPVGNTITVTRDDNGLIRSRTDAAGRTWKIDYNASSQPTAFHGPGGVGDYAWTYDARGNMVSADPAAGPTVSMAYDGSNLASIKRGDATMATFTYKASGDGAGLVESITDAHGKKAQVAYDSAGRVVSEVDPNGTVSYKYDAHGKIVERVNPAGGKRTWSYGDRGQLLTATDELGKVSRYGYDDALRMVSRTDRNGAVTTYAHDAVGRVLRQVSPDKVMSFAYDGLGRQVQAVSGDVTSDLAYDKASRLVSRVTTGPGLPRMEFTYTHCECGAVESVTGPGGTTTYDFDHASGQLANVIAPDGGSFGFTWDSAGRLSKMTRPNQVSDVLAWNDQGHLASRTQVGADGSQVSGVGYGYDAGGRRTSVTDDAGVHSFSYDTAGNLTGADHPADFAVADEVFSYDKLGNRVSDADNPAGSLVYDAANRLVKDAKHDYTHDAEGNLTSAKVRATGAVTRFAWDADHRMVKLTKPSGATVGYRYDASGKRVQATRSSDGQVTSWGYEREHVAAVWRNTGAGHQLVQSFVTSPSGNPLQARVDGATVFPVLDGLGSVTGTLDGSGKLASSTAYSVFGQPASAGAVGAGDTYGYTGHAWDADAGMHYARARWYDSGAGRFASEDPVDASNLYSYVRNQPATYTDPTGMVTAAEYGTLSTIAQLALGPSLIALGELENWAFDQGLSKDFICGLNGGIAVTLLLWGNAEFLMAMMLSIGAGLAPVILWMVLWAYLAIAVLALYDTVEGKAGCGGPPV